jgi:hypothetical protein
VSEFVLEPLVVPDSVLADRKFDLEQLNGMRPWEDALDDCLLRYREVLFHG